MKHNSTLIIFALLHVRLIQLCNKELPLTIAKQFLFLAKFLTMLPVGYFLVHLLDTFIAYPFEPPVLFSASYCLFLAGIALAYHEMEDYIGKKINALTA